jgi:hypothetical protein
MSETQTTPPVAAPAATSQSGTTVSVVTGADESEPFRLNPAYISLGLPRKVFKKEVGGEPE